LEIINGTLVINRKRKLELVRELIAKGYDRVYPKGKTNETTNEEEEDSDDGKGFEYLLSMQFWSLTLEKLEKLTAERDAKKEELEFLKAQAIEDLWLNDLDDFLDEWNKIEHEFDSLPRTTFGTSAKKEKPKRRSRKSTKVKDEDDASTSYQTNGDDSDDDYNPGNIIKRKVSKTKPVQSKLSFGALKKENEQENSLSNLLSKTSSSSSLNTLDNNLNKVKLEDNTASSTKKVPRKLKRIKLEEDSKFKKPSNTLTNWLNPSSSSKSVDPMDIEISSLKKESDNEISGSSSSTSSKRSSKKRKVDDDDFLMDDGEESENDENENSIKSPIGRRL